MSYNNETFRKFNEIYEKKMTRNPSYKKAYEQAEEEYEREHGTKRYSDYNSFRNCRKRFLRKAKFLHTK